MSRPRTRSNSVERNGRGIVNYLFNTIDRKPRRVKNGIRQIIKTHDDDLILNKAAELFPDHP